MTPLLSIRNLTFSYPRQSTPALDGLDLDIAPGDFLLLCGPSGCGKSTLLRQLKPLLAPHGSRSGEVLFDGESLAQLEQRRQAQEIGFVFQSPENQIVTDKVWHELAFGLESLGYDTPTIRRRVAEMASFFGIQGWFHKSVHELSGGQKQLLNLASVMVLQPRVLILDEPTSQLDPIAAGDFLNTVGKVNRELGTTVILSEHRLEEVFPFASRMVVLDQGRVLLEGEPREVCAALKDSGHTIYRAMPAAARIWSAVPDAGGTCPISVQEGRNWLADYEKRHPLQELPPVPAHIDTGIALQAEELCFRYQKDLPDTVKDMSLTVQRGEFVALLGGNGTGKTTALKLLAGLLKPYRGRVRCDGLVGMLPQDPKALFVKKTLGEDLREVFADKEIEEAAQEDRIAWAVELCQLQTLLDRHPYDLSGGEQQRAGLAKVLLLKPQILLLDEPTKGLDAGFKELFAGLLQTLCSQGVAIMMASHDLDFCARYAHRCALFFDGAIVDSAPPGPFFSGNSFYTTSASRMTRGFLPQAVTAEDVIAACGGTASAEATPRNREVPPDPTHLAPPAKVDRARVLPRGRKVLAAVAAGIATVLLFQFTGLLDLTAWMTLLGVTNGARRQLFYYGGFSAALIVLALALGSRRTAPRPEAAVVRRKLSRRTVWVVALVLLLIPLTLWVGEFYLESRKYYVTSLLILMECMLPFFLVFEGRKPQARELVLIAVLCALGVAGRQVFFMLPEFKPVIALVVVSGVALGGETGFFVGAMTMLLSNMLFRQGPWTPWQMFAMGLIGFLSGVLSSKGLLRRSRGALCTFGALASILVYGAIMNFQSALTWSHDLTAGILLSYYVAGFPMDCIQAAATWIFLWFGGEAMLEKLDRVKVKYGLVE